MGSINPPGQISSSTMPIRDPKEDIKNVLKQLQDVENHLNSLSAPYGDLSIFWTLSDRLVRSVLKTEDFCYNEYCNVQSNDGSISSKSLYETSEIIGGQIRSFSSLLDRSPPNSPEIDKAKNVLLHNVNTLQNIYNTHLNSQGTS